MKFGRFTFGEDKHPENDKVVDPAKQLHEPAYIVMKMGSGEISDLDQAYVADNLDQMLADEVLHEAWSRVHIGQPIFQYKQTLKPSPPNGEEIIRITKRSHTISKARNSWLSL